MPFDTKIPNQNAVGVAQSGRAQGCGPCGRGFESRRPPQSSTHPGKKQQAKRPPWNLKLGAPPIQVFSQLRKSYDFRAVMTLLAARSSRNVTSTKPVSDRRPSTSETE